MRNFLVLLAFVLGMLAIANARLVRSKLRGGRVNDAAADAVDEDDDVAENNMGDQGRQQENDMPDQDQNQQEPAADREEDNNNDQDQREEEYQSENSGRGGDAIGRISRRPSAYVTDSQIRSHRHRH